MSFISGGGQGAAFGATAGSVVPGIGTAIGAGIGFVVGGLTSLFSEASAAEQRNEQVRRAQELVAQGLIGQDELADRLRAIDRSFNSRLTSVLNTTAIRSRGIANRGVIGAAVAGSIEGARLATEEGVISQAQRTNTGLTSAIAQLELSKKSPDLIGAFVEGGLAGTEAALEVGKSLSGRELPTLDKEGGASPAGLSSIPSIESAGSFNPFLRDQNRRIGNIDDPLSRIPTQSPFLGNIQRGVFE